MEWYFGKLIYKITTILFKNKTSVDKKQTNHNHQNNENL